MIIHMQELPGGAFSGVLLYCIDSVARQQPDTLPNDNHRVLGCYWHLLGWSQEVSIAGVYGGQQCTRICLLWIQVQKHQLA